MIVQRLKNVAHHVLFANNKRGVEMQQTENSVKDIVVKAIGKKYPHYTGSIVFKKIPDEFASSARLISITDELDSKRSFKYLMASSETKVVEIYNVTDRLKDFLCRWLNFFPVRITVNSYEALLQHPRFY